MEAQGRGNREIKDLITEYLDGNEQGVRELMTWFPNHVMDCEAEQQSGAGRYVREMAEEHTGTDTGNEHSAQGMDC